MAPTADIEASMDIGAMETTVWKVFLESDYIDGLAQDCSNSSADVLGLLQSCARPSIFDTSFSLNIALWLLNGNKQQAVGWNSDVKD